MVKVQPEHKVCPICSANMEFVGYGQYHTETSVIQTTSYYCPACNIFHRHVSQGEMLSHNRQANYAQPENDELSRTEREGFFNYLLDIVERQSADQQGESHDLRLMDFGCAHGHLLTLAQQRGFDTVGVEINDKMVSYCRERGLSVYSNLDSVTEPVDIVTLIDSFYYVDNPRKFLADLKTHLTKNGFIMIRVTNRNYLARLFRRLGKLNLAGARISRYCTLGDEIISYSVRGLKRLLNLSGFTKVVVIPEKGTGKQIDVGRRFGYVVTYLTSLLLLKQAVITPGIIVIARPTD